MSRRIHWILVSFSTLMSACLFMPEKKEVKQDSPWHYIDERSLRGFRGEVKTSETRVYQEKTDPTGTFRQNTSRFVEEFTQRGELLESRFSDLEKNLDYGSSHPVPYGFYSAEAIYYRGQDPKWYGRFETDGNGLVLKETIESTLPNGSSQVEYECFHEHDGKARRTGRECRDRSGATAESIAVAYDARGRILSRMQKGSVLGDLDLRPGMSWMETSGLGAESVHFREAYTYSSDGDFTLERVWIHETGVSTQRMVFQDGLPVSVFHLGPAGDTLGSEAYAHDGRGNVVEMKLDYDPWYAGWKWSETFRYEYDSQGNWTVRNKYFVQSENEQWMREEKREITYH
jgi:hypothetical protein